VVIANSSPPVAYLSTDGGSHWYNIGTPQASGGNPAAAIYDIAVSEVRESIRYIAAAGEEAGDTANLWYFNSGAPVPVWKETRNLTDFSAGNEVAAVTFSPGFLTDNTMLAVTEHDSGGVRLQILNLNAEKWNSSADHTAYPLDVVSNSGVTGLNSASISLSPSYLASDEATHRIFIGLTVNGNASAIATSGIYRFIETTRTNLSTDKKIHSVAFSGSYLVAGRYDASTVYYSTNPLATTPTVSTSTTTKGPGGGSRVIVAWAGSNVLAGTSGNESAFAISADRGSTFNDISLIDTIMVHARDVAVSPDGSKVYLVTDDGTDLSLWRKTTDWLRVFSLQGSADYIARIAPDDDDTIYLARKGSTTLYYNNSSGATQWLPRTCRVSVQDLAVESALVAYALNSAGGVSKTDNSGLTWGMVNPTTLDNGATIVSVSPGTILAGSQNGYVAYSTDGNSSWTKINERIQSGAGKVQVVADEYFKSNLTIYAASDTAGQNIKKWQIDTSTSWIDIFNGNLGRGIYGLVVNNNTLYALEFDSGTGKSKLWLYLSPTLATSTSTDWSYSATTTTTDVDDTSVHLNATPRALKASTGKIWAVKTNGTNKLYSFSDVTVQITVVRPAQGFTSGVSTATGIAHDINFTWERPYQATEYELQIALDEDFYGSIATITIATEASKVVATVGPNQTGNNQVNFMPGTTYYWRTRTTKPLHSAYSRTRYFSVEPLVAAVPQLLTPANGSTDVSRKPSFSWNPINGATEYQFMLSENNTMTPAIVDTSVDVSGYTMTQELDYGGTYFWKVRAITPSATEWSTLANFTVEKEPTETVPPLIVEQAPPTVIKLPEPPPQNVITVTPAPLPPEPGVPGYLITAIIIAGVLALAVIVLIIVPLPARLLPAEPLKGPFRVARGFGQTLGRLREDAASRLRISRTPGKAGAARPGPEAEAKPEEGQSLSFAAKSFLWMTTTEARNGKQHLSSDDEEALGKKLASRIKAASRGRPIYQKYPEDAAMFLQIWARYGSRDDTNQYLIKSFQSRPENAISLLKCFLTAPERPGSAAAAENGFTRIHYNALEEVVDTDNVCEALVRLYKPELDRPGKTVPGDPADRAIAYQFLSIYHEVKDTEISDTDTK
jgi:hypothetical protein